MQTCLKVGITGGIGSGKSTVCRMLGVLGIPLYDADARAKWLMANDPNLKAELIKAFGEAVYLPDGSINRSYLSGLVFQNQEKLAQLNAIVHPAVRKDGQQWQDDVCRSGVAYTLKEAALLIESGSYRDLDILVVVTAPVKLRVARVCARDGVTQVEVQRRIRAQLSDNARRKHADFIIRNNGKRSLVRQVWQLHQMLVARSRVHTR